MKTARDILLDHAKNPRNCIKEAPVGNLQGECKNPLCGDHVRLFISLENDKILSCQHQMSGCTICTASTSLMSLKITSLTLKEALLLKESLEKALLDDGPWPDHLAPFEPFSHLRINPSRIPCALIPWQALRNIH